MTMGKRSRGIRHMVMSEPTYINLLLQSGMNFADIADQIGVAASTIGEGVRKNTIKQAYDLAAKSILQDTTRPVTEEMNQGKPMSLNALLAELRWHFEMKTVFDLTENEVKLLNQPLRQILKERDNNERKVY